MTSHPIPDGPLLETERLLLRAPRAEDLSVMEPFWATDRARFVGGPGDVGRAWRVMAIFIGHWAIRGFGLMAMERKADGRVLGAVGPWFPGGWPERELGWSVWDAESEGKGYAAEAARAIRAHVYADLGWKTAVSYIDPANAASIRLAEALGCTPDPAAPRPDDSVAVWRHPAPAEAAA